MFEIKAKDGLGRIGKLTIGGKSVETPTLMPVINPGRIIVSPKEMKRRFGIEILITNSYIIYRSKKLKEKMLERGVHQILDFDGIVVTDSGSFQLMNYGDLEVENAEIVEFQNRIGSDVSTFLDLPTLPDESYDKANLDLEMTLERAKEALELGKGCMNGTIQGSTYLDLRKRACQEMAKLDFEIHPIGGMVPLLMKYRFSELSEVILECKRNLPLSRPIHLFGAGHPMLLSFSVLLGCDLFDSAAYVLYARDQRYLTPYGTKKLEDMRYFPCSCRICEGSSVEEVLKAREEEKIKFLTLHNLYVTFSELLKIKQAIHEGSLWELLESRIRSHPELLKAYRVLEKYKTFLEKLEPSTKRSSFKYTGGESKLRPIFFRVKKKLKRLNVQPERCFNHEFFGPVPKELSQTYPFHTFQKFVLDEVETVRRIADYQFGVGIGEKMFSDIEIKRGATGKIRYILDEGGLLATLRPKDGYLVLTFNGAKKLHSLTSGLRVLIDKEAHPFAREGRDVFCKFVKRMDKNLRASDEVLVV
ncbi:MAG: tRNA guanosine(15) transglycosylase TgtA, partial [Candidatus Methanofastidiosia archaeon]